MCSSPHWQVGLSWFREKLSPANREQRLSRWADFAKNCLPRIGSKELPRFREKYRALGRQKMGSNIRPRYIQFRDIRDRDISGLHCTMHIKAQTKFPPFRRRQFQTHFLEWKFQNFNWNLTEVCSQGSSNIGSDKWLGADQVTSHYLNQWWSDNRRIFVSLSLNELIFSKRLTKDDTELACRDNIWVVYCELKVSSMIDLDHQCQYQYQNQYWISINFSISLSILISEKLYTTRNRSSIAFGCAKYDDHLNKCKH